MCRAFLVEDEDIPPYEDGDTPVWRESDHYAWKMVFDLPDVILFADQDLANQLRDACQRYGARVPELRQAPAPRHVNTGDQLLSFHFLASSPMLRMITIE